jgi:hypothetical protein
VCHSKYASRAWIKQSGFCWNKKVLRPLKMKMTWKEKRRLGKLRGFRNIIPWIAISSTKHHIEFAIRVWYSQCPYDVHNPYICYCFCNNFSSKKFHSNFLDSSKQKGNYYSKSGAKSIFLWWIIFGANMKGKILPKKDNSKEGYQKLIGIAKFNIMALSGNYLFM